MKKEISVPLMIDVDQNRNLFSILQERTKRTPDDRLVEYRGADGQWTGFTATQFTQLVTRLAKGLIAHGVSKGDTIAILSRTRWEWTALDLSLIHI